MLEISVIIILIALNGYFALTEAAFISSRKSLILNYMKKKRKDATFIMKMMDQPEKFLSSIQVCITLIGVVSGAFGGIALSDDLTQVLRRVSILSAYASEISIVVIVSAITYFSIVLGELVPKTIAMNNPERIILFSVPVIRIVMLVSMPVINLLALSTKAVLFLTGFRNRGSGHDPVRDIVAMIRMATMNRELEKEQEKILLNTINMTKVMLVDIMVEKNDIRFLNSGLTIAEAFLQVHMYHHTRYPVIENNDPDKVLGYVNFKDIVGALKINPLDPTLKGVLRPILSFKSKEKIIDMLPKMIKNNQHIAIITKNKNTTVGLVTMEDIIESILGDISDEYDILPEYFYKITDNRYIIGGGSSMRKIDDLLKIGFDELNVNLSEWLVKRIGANMTTERRVEYKKCVFIVKKTRLKQVYEAILEI